MRQLRLIGPSEEGTHLIVEAPTGDRFRLPIDERLRAACRGDLSRLGQLEIEHDGTLRPREIQSRVRAGESAEQVAATAGVPVERVLRFAYPVLQERQRVVAQARATRVRRGGSTPAETLAELVDERLVGRGTDAATLSWDAWRREDGAWTVCLRWHGTRDYSTTWTFDLAGRTLQADDPAAEQLIAAEFHLRTITPVTPLAAAARKLAPEPAAPPATPGPARGSGHGPAPGPSRGGAHGSADGGPGSTRGSARGSAAGAGLTSIAGPPTAGNPTAATATPGSGPSAGPTVGTAALPLPLPDLPESEDADPDPDLEDERARRAHVPSWDDILLGVRRKH
jgi:Protein of unknown function (DUF3071)